jgi:hypothetical protein
MNISRTIWTETMSDNPLNRIPDFDRVSIPAVVVADGEDVSAALSVAGIVDPITLPVVFGDSPEVEGGILGNGMTPNLVAVLETKADDQPDEFALETGSAEPWQAEPQRDSRIASSSLPAAYGIQPLAPVRQRGRQTNILK